MIIGYPFVDRLQSDQKSRHNIAKTLLETSFLQYENFSKVL